MKSSILKRLAITSKMESEYSEGSQYSCEIKFPTIGSGMYYECRAGDYDYKEKVQVNQISFNMYSSGEVYYAKKADISSDCFVLFALGLCPKRLHRA